MRRNSAQYLGSPKQRGVFMTKLLLAIGMSLALSGAALAQQNSTKKQIVGAWSLVSVISETEDGKRGEPFGTAPKGVMIFSSAGHFSLFQSRAEIPKIAANDRAISDDLRAVLSEPATKQRFEDIASYINPMSGAELLAYIRTEQALWKPVIEQISTFKAAPK